MIVNSAFSDIELLSHFFVRFCYKEGIAVGTGVIHHARSVRRPVQLRTVQVWPGRSAHSGHSPAGSLVRGPDPERNLRPVGRQSKATNFGISHIRDLAFGQIVKAAGSNLAYPDIKRPILVREKR